MPRSTSSETLLIVFSVIKSTGVPNFVEFEEYLKSIISASLRPQYIIQLQGQSSAHTTHVTWLLACQVTWLPGSRDLQVTWPCWERVVSPDDDCCTSEADRITLMTRSSLQEPLIKLIFLRSSRCPISKRMVASFSWDKKLQIKTWSPKTSNLSRSKVRCSTRATCILFIKHI